MTGSNGFSTFTIPAGSQTLDVTLTPAVDVLAEGPETATLQLGSGNGYLVALPAVATVTIADDDTPPLTPAQQAKLKPSRPLMP